MQIRVLIRNHPLLTSVDLPRAALSDGGRIEPVALQRA
jgi:hypothetical protein